jgi:hypothetical protein
MKFFRLLLGSKKEKLSAEDKRQIQDPPAEHGPEPHGQASEESYWLFLSYFSNAKDIDKDKFIDSWSEALGRSPKAVIKEFLSKGLIMHAGVKEKLGAMYSAEDIKHFLTTQGLSTSGSKAQLLSRYVEARPEEAGKKASTMVGDFLLCTPEGRKEVRKHGNRTVYEEDSARLEMKHLLTRKKIDQAAEVVNVYMDSVQRLRRDNTWAKDDVKMIMEINDVPGLTRAEVEEARLYAAIDLLWDGKMKSLYYTPIPSFHQFALFASIVIGKKRSREELQRYSEQEFVNKVEIMCLDDSCQKCKAVAGRRYTLKNAPLLPVDGCTHENGCRCCYTPVVD